MKLQFDNKEQESEPVAKVRVEVVDHELIKLYINSINVINIWGTYKGKQAEVIVFEDLLNKQGFNLEVV